MNPADRLNPIPLNGNQNFRLAIARFFKFRENHTNFRTDMTMGYRLAVNPAILSNARLLERSGDLLGELVIPTAL